MALVRTPPEPRHPVELRRGLDHDLAGRRPRRPGDGRSSAWSPRPPGRLVSADDAAMVGASPVSAGSQRRPVESDLAGSPPVSASRGFGRRARGYVGGHRSIARGREARPKGDGDVRRRTRWGRVRARSRVPPAWWPRPEHDFDRLRRGAGPAPRRRPGHVGRARAAPRSSRSARRGPRSSGTITGALDEFEASLRSTEKDNVDHRRGAVVRLHPQPAAPRLSPGRRKTGQDGARRTQGQPRRPRPGGRRPRCGVVNRIDDRMSRLEPELAPLRVELDRRRPAVLPRRQGQVGRRDPRDARPAARHLAAGRAVERRLPRRRRPRRPSFDV